MSPSFPDNLSEKAEQTRAEMPFPVHPHMLRHGCGYALANAGHDTRSLQAYLGHKNIQHTVRAIRNWHRIGSGISGAEAAMPA